VCHCIVGTAAFLGHEGRGGHGPAGVALPGQEGSGDGINYNGKDSGRCHKRGGADNNDSNESGHLTMQGNNNGSNNGGRDVTLRASYSQSHPLRV
jgi:hypothetical protein